MNDVKKTSQLGPRIRVLLSIALLAVAGLVFFNREYILDQFFLFGYKPPSEIVAIAERIQLTDTAERYFYASRPEINSAQEFNDNCEAEDEQSIILGCYTLRRIFLYNVEDERLAGVKEVTAAHEMLHAAYARLSSREKAKINQLIDIEVAKVEDQRIKDLIELYNRTEPGQLQNEMHSILATEVRVLSPELEDYYRRYFMDRQLIVGYSQQYESVFSDLENRREQLINELNELNATIKQRSDDLNSGINALNNDITVFNQRARSGGFSSEAEFNRERQRLINQQQFLQQTRNEIEVLISEYNRKREELISINGESERLNQSLDSTPNDVPEL